jgi:class 3 adenylate cyclase
MFAPHRLPGGAHLRDYQQGFSHRTAKLDRWHPCLGGLMHNIGRAVDDSIDFERWLIARSFRMLVPLCRLGLLVALLMLLVVDPVLFANGTWGDKPHHAHLPVWHACAGLYFAVFLGLAPRLAGHRARKRCLAICMAVGAALFTWFGFISWVLSGDMSTYAIFLLTMVCVFSYPGRLRKALGIASAVSLLASIVWFDGSSIFYTSGAAMNLLALAVVALLLDAHLMTMSRALYDEKRLVEHERARADAVLFNALPMAIANELKRNNAVAAQKHARVAVLFVDIVGFTRFSAMHPPDAVLRVLDTVFSEFDALVDRHGVEKIKTIGDAYMVIGKDAVAPVAELALDMFAAVAQYNQRTGSTLAVRAGMHVGPAITGVIGVKRLHYDVWGDAVNTASRMESTGQPGRIQVSAAVWQALRLQHRFECRGTIAIKGKGPMCTFFLLDRAIKTDQQSSAHEPTWPVDGSPLLAA